jgi:hypothetical protein
MIPVAHATGKDLSPSGLKESTIREYIQAQIKF